MYQEVSQKQSVYYVKYKSALVQFLTLEWIKCPAREEGKITEWLSWPFSPIMDHLRLIQI